MSLRFALLGAAGFVAPRHMAAIKAVGGEIVACHDPFDSVGVIDRYFPDAAFFTEFERFDRHVYKLQCSDRPIDYVSICSPNHLHDAHMRWALRIGAHPICEKPLVLDPRDVDNLGHLEASTGKMVNAVLQLRLHEKIIDLKKKVDQGPGQVHEVDVTTITPRGNWYHYSWKGDQSRSGGLAANIGIHLFDMMIWVFGGLQYLKVQESSPTRSVGYAELERARLRWFLSIDSKDLAATKHPGPGAFRSVTIDGEEFPFGHGFEDLHIRSYEEVVAGRGFTALDARPAIEMMSILGKRSPERLVGSECHPLALS